MLDPSAAKILVDAGGWTVVIVIVVAAAGLLWRKKWVPGWLWLQERADRLASDLQAKANARALTRLAREVSRLAKTIASIDEQLAAVLKELQELRAEIREREARHDRGDAGG